MKTATALLALASIPVWAAPAPPIGVATAAGSFRIDDATVAGNATLFEGADVETAAAATLNLSSGAQVSLLRNSRGRIFGDHLILERGASELRQAPGFRLEARGLSIHPETGQSSARVALTGAAKVQVTALAGSFRVLNRRGLLVADIASGKTLEFEPLPQGGGASEPWKMTGCLRAVNGHYLLTDDTTSVTAELTGGGIDAEGSNRVEITGTLDPTATPVSGATQVLKVTQIRRLGKGCAAGGKGAAAAGAGGAAGKAAGAGHAGIGASTVAIIGGVAAAGAVAGLAASDALPGQGGGGTMSR